MRNAVIDQLTELAATDSRLFLITGDLGFGVLEEFEKFFPNQFLNVGVAEQNMTAVATGLALEGHVTFTYSIANFPTLRCLEQIRNDACYHDANVNILAVGGGFSYGALGMSHHATEDISIMRALPNMCVFVPSDPWQAKVALKLAIETPTPCYIRIDKSSAGLPAERLSPREFLKARVHREGSDVSLLSCGGILAEVLDAAEKLSADGISARVVEFPSIKPLDINALEAEIAHTGRLVTIEEHSRVGGFGGAIAEASYECAEKPSMLVRMGLDDVYSSVVGSQQYLREYYGLDSMAIQRTVKANLDSLS